MRSMPRMSTAPIWLVELTWVPPHALMSRSAEAVLVDYDVRGYVQPLHPMQRTR